MNACGNKNESDGSTSGHEIAPGFSEVPEPGRHGGEVIGSEHLLKGRRCVEIHHNGTTYTLRATRLGKLILTK